MTVNRLNAPVTRSASLSRHREAPTARYIFSLNRIFDLLLILSYLVTTFYKLNSSYIFILRFMFSYCG